MKRKINIVNTKVQPLKVAALNISEVHYLNPEYDLALDDVQPERHLLAAMLQRAIADVLSSIPIERHIQREALGWVMRKSKDNRLRKFSFEWVCQALDIDSDTLRSSILEHYNSKVPFFMDKRYSQNIPLFQRRFKVIK